MENKIIEQRVQKKEQSLVMPLYFKGKTETSTLAKKRIAFIEKRARANRVTSSQIIRDAIDMLIECASN